MSLRLFFASFSLLLSAAFTSANGAEWSEEEQTSEEEKDTVRAKKHKSYNPIKWVGNYLSNTNKHSDRPFDFSMLIGPSYTVATSIGLGITASGLYSWDKTEATLPKSNVSVFGNVSVTGMLAVGLKGDNFLPQEKYRFSYVLFFYSFPGTFWGIGYKNGNDDDHKTDYDKIKLQFKPTFLFRITEAVYLGPVLDLEWVNSFGFDDDTLLEGEDKSVFNFGLGINFTYDTRDFVLNAYRGNFFRLEQMFYPSGLGNDFAFSYTDVTYSTYYYAWRGGVVAMELHGMFNYDDVPWVMLAQVGVQGRMRGYYEGRYRDRNILEGQVELRQHIKGRHGVAVWGGLANVFPNFNEIYFDEILPNVGIGYRWEFKERVNVRLDLGFTNDSPNFVFNVNEAF